MYLISTQLSKNRKYRDCVVWHTNNSKHNPYNVTNQVADRFGLEFKDGRIRIYFGSGTGFMVLRQLIEENSIDPMDHSQTAKAFDVSVF